MNNLVSAIGLDETLSELKSGKLKLENYISYVCRKIDKNNKFVNAVLFEENRTQRLLAQAKKLEAKYPNVESRPLLYGVLVGIKDIIKTDGYETKAGSALPASLFIGEQASVVTKLINAGALILGKTETTEFAFFEPSPARNPHNLECTPGGSSSGSAAGVAAGFFSLSLGTQTIGSVTRPAAFCGIVGFKPSFGRIDNDGVIPFSISVDHLGFFVNDVSEINIPAAVLCNNWDFNFKCEENKPVIGVVTGKYLAQADAEMINFFKTQILQLQDLGYKVIEVTAMENIEEINTHHKNLNAYEFAEVHKEWFSKHKNLYRIGTVELIEKGKTISIELANSAKQEILNFRKQINDISNEKKIDLWISPATTGEAPKGTATGNPIMNLPWTFLGFPTITAPFGQSENNLPLGLQFAGKFMEDEKLLSDVKGIQKKITNSTLRS